MNQDKVRQLANVILLIVTLVINGLANGLPINGQTTGEISDRFPIYFVPAGYVFSIWGLIYLGLLAFVIYQALPSQRQNPRLQKLGYAFALSCLANSAWILAWHYEQFGLTVLLLLTVLICLIVSYLRLGIGRQPVSRAETWLVRVPFSIYLGWATVATIANITQWLYFVEWHGWGVAPEIWAVVMLVVGVLVTAAMSFSRGDMGYQLVIIWAYVGIAVKQAATPIVANTAWAMAALVLVILIAGTFYFTRHRAVPALSTSRPNL